MKTELGLSIAAPAVSLAEADPNALGLKDVFSVYLEARKLGALLTRSITLRLPNGLQYTPDFVEVRHGFALTAYEVGGDAAKIKEAATAFPWIAFFLVTRPHDSTAWQIERVRGAGNEPLPLPSRPLSDHLGPQD